MDKEANTMQVPERENDMDPQEAVPRNAAFQISVILELLDKVKKQMDALGLHENEFKLHKEFMSLLQTYLVELQGQSSLSTSIAERINSASKSGRLEMICDKFDMSEYLCAINDKVLDNYMAMVLKDVSLTEKLAYHKDLWPTFKMVSEMIFNAGNKLLSDILAAESNISPPE